MSLDVDWDAALASVNGDRDLLKLVINAFLEESVQLLDQISTAVENDDAKLLNRCGHTLKGTMCSLGAARWSYMALQLEELGATGTTTGAPPMVDELKRHLPSLLEQLQTFSAEQSD